MERARTYYLVRYRKADRDYIARFCDYHEAHLFAKAQEVADVISGGKRRGLIGQWDRGVASVEFNHLNGDFR